MTNKIGYFIVFAAAYAAHVSRGVTAEIARNHAQDAARKATEFAQG